MAELVKITEINSVPSGKAEAFEVAGRRIALFNVNGVFFAIDDECPHAGASLASGFVNGGKVGCPWHGAEFDLGTGAVLCAPARENVRSYRVVIDGNDVKVEV